jgi:hypothetical protein
MRDDAGLLDRPTKAAVRLLALGLLEEAEAGRRALHGGEDAEALHDLRVALRRLRSCLRSYAPLLKASVGADLRTPLRDRRRTAPFPSIDHTLYN